MTRSHPKVRGELAEARFLLKAASEGLVVSMPWGDSQPFDFLVGRRRRFHRVQVKSTTRKQSNGYQVHCFCGSGMRPYRTSELDFLAAYIVPEDTWYVIPVRAFTPRRMICVYPRQRPTRGGRFERYREAWHLLRR
jgi:hypothetical protein